MKKVAASLAVLVLLGVIVFAAGGMWKPKWKPKLSLTRALSVAEQALGNNASGYYCLGAGVLSGAAPGGDWTFYFGSAHGKGKWVIIHPDERAEVRDQPPQG